MRLLSLQTWILALEMFSVIETTLKTASYVWRNDSEDDCPKADVAAAARTARAAIKSRLRFILFTRPNADVERRPVRDGVEWTIRKPRSAGPCKPSVPTAS